MNTVGFYPHTKLLNQLDIEINRLESVKKKQQELLKEAKAKLFHHEEIIGCLMAVKAICDDAIKVDAL